MRRLLAAAALAAVGLSLTVPAASAHNDPNVHTMAWGASPNPTTANDGREVYANDELVAAVLDFDDGVRSWDVVIRPVSGGQPSTCHEDLAQNGSEFPTKVYINCPWDTTRATKHTLPGSTGGADAANPNFSRTWQSEDLGPSVNGKYTVEITAYNGGQKFSCGLITGCEQLPVEPHNLYQSGTNPARWRELWVTNGVSQPTGVTNAYDSGSNRITVSWAPNPEPDASYLVQEKIGDGKWSAGAAVPGNSTRYERVIEQPGTYQYRVAAVRPSPTANSGAGATATKKSDFVAAQAVEIAQVTPPSTAGANTANGAPDGGEPGVFIPGDTTSSTGATGPRASGPGRSGPSSAGRFTGVTSGPRATGATSGPGGSTAHEPGEAEGEGPDEGFSSTLPYSEGQQFAEDDGLGEEASPRTLGGVVPKPRDTRQLLIYMAVSLMLFVFSMQLVVLLRRSRPAAAASTGNYDDFDDWLGF